MRHRSRGKKNNHVALWVGGAVVLGAVGIFLYERKPAAASTGPGVSSAPASGSDSVSLPSPVTSVPVLPGFQNDSSMISITGNTSVPVAPVLPGFNNDSSMISAPLPVTPTTYTAPNAPRAVSILWPGGTWKPATSGTSYPAGTHVHMQVTGAASGYLDTVKKQIAANTFGAWSVVAYPPGSGNPKTWPDGDTSTYRLEFALNKATVLSSGTFGMQAWVYVK